MKRLAFLVFVFLTVLGCAVYVRAQRSDNPVLPGAVLSGSDIGWQVQNPDGKEIVGRLVVRVDGKWVPAKFAGGPSVVPLHAK